MRLILPTHQKQLAKTPSRLLALVSSVFFRVRPTCPWHPIQDRAGRHLEPSLWASVGQATARDKTAVRWNVTLDQCYVMDRDGSTFDWLWLLHIVLLSRSALDQIVHKHRSSDELILRPSRRCEVARWYTLRLQCGPPGAEETAKTSAEGSPRSDVHPNIRTFTNSPQRNTISRPLVWNHTDLVH